MSSSKSKSTFWSEWRDPVNKAAQELEDWLKTKGSHSVGDGDDGESTGHKPWRRIVTIKRSNEDAPRDLQWDHMAWVAG